MAAQTFSTRAGAIDGYGLGVPISQVGGSSDANISEQSQGVNHVGQLDLEGQQCGEHGVGHHHRGPYPLDNSNIGQAGMFGLPDKSIGSTGSGLTEAVTHHHGHSAHAGQNHKHHEPLDPAVAAGLGAGHHDADPLPAIHGGGSNSSPHPIADRYSSEGGVGAFGTGVGVAGLGGAALASHEHPPSAQAPPPVEGDVYGKSGGMNEYGSQGIAVHPELKGSNRSGQVSTQQGISSRAPAPIAGDVYGKSGGLNEYSNKGIEVHDAVKGSNASSGGAGVAAVAGVTGGNEVLNELKQELKANQSAAVTQSSHDLETQGPHGFVWSDSEGKYVHQRELDGKGSTGVDPSTVGHARE